MKIKQKENNIIFIKLLIAIILSIFLSESVFAEDCTSYIDHSPPTSYDRNTNQPKVYDSAWGYAYGLAGGCESFKGNCDKAVEYYIKSVEYYLTGDYDHGDPLADEWAHCPDCEMYQRVGMSYESMSDCYKDSRNPLNINCTIAAKYAIQAAEYYSKGERYDFAGMAYTRIGNCYSDGGNQRNNSHDCDKAAEYYIKAADAYKNGESTYLNNEKYFQAGYNYNSASACLYNCEWEWNCNTVEVKKYACQRTIYIKLSIDSYKKSIEVGEKSPQAIQPLIDSSETNLKYYESECDNYQTNPIKTNNSVEKTNLQIEEDNKLNGEQNNERLQLGLANALINIKNENAKLRLQKNIEKFQQEYQERMQILEGIEIESINEKTGEVSLIAKEEVKFFGFIKWKITKRFKIDENGNINEESSWYKFLYIQTEANKKQLQITDEELKKDWCPEGGEWNFNSSVQNLTQNKWKIDKLITSGKYSGLCRVLFTLINSNGTFPTEYYFYENGKLAYLIMEINGQKIEKKYID